jgi:hypothetical protein
VTVLCHSVWISRRVCVCVWPKPTGRGRSQRGSLLAHLNLTASPPRREQTRERFGIRITHAHQQQQRHQQQDKTSQSGILLSGTSHTTSNNSVIVYSRLYYHYRPVRYCPRSSCLELSAESSRISPFRSDVCLLSCSRGY